MTETAETVTANTDTPMIEGDTPVALLRDPLDFLKPELTPLPTWTLRELIDALGNQTVAEIWGVTDNNARQVRYRGTASLERMQALQAAVRADEIKYREALVTIYTTGAFRRQA